jgi:adenylosuccinate synthase
MPVTVVVGGQFGSEGKGKVAHTLAGEMRAAAAVRVGGPNSGHTVITETGKPLVFRQLPTAALIPGCLSIIPAGAYIDTDLLLHEISLLRATPGHLAIDPKAVLIATTDTESEKQLDLRETIGSTLSGTGGAVLRRIARGRSVVVAGASEVLRPFVRPVAPLLRELLSEGMRIIVEGTQGFGLSLVHSPYYPYVTSRDTTAAGFLSEAGLSPFDVDDIVLVLRAFPIRVRGNSGPLPRETDWQTITAESGSQTPLVEYTSVTRAVRRIAYFDAEIVRQAVLINQPTRIVMNHLDYIESPSDLARSPVSARVRQFIATVESAIARRIDYYGFSPATLLRATSSASRIVESSPSDPFRSVFRR